MSQVTPNIKSVALSVVIPVFNSENTLGPVVDSLVGQLQGNLRSLEIILVNDCSKDASEEVCVDLFNKYPKHVRFYSLSKNVSEHNAVMAGLNQVSGEYVVIMDDDSQNPVTEIPQIIEEALRGQWDVVYSSYEKKEHFFLRNLGSWFNGKVANLMLGKPKELYLSSFKLINRFIVDEIIKYDLPFPYIDGLILRTTDRIGSIRVKHNPRKSGKSGYTLMKLIGLWLNMFTSFSILPLRIAVVLGFIFSGVGFVMGAVTVIEKLANPDLPIGWPALVVSVSIFAGIQLLAMGMIGEYVGRIFLSQNKKPQYTIRRAYKK